MTTGAAPDRSAEMSRRFEIPVFIAALAVLPALLIEQSGAAGPWPVVATALNWASWLVFLTEIVVMVRLVPDRREWFGAHALDVAITVVTFPLALSALQALRLLRLVRILRTVRLLRFIRAGGIARRWFSPAGLAWSGFIVVLAVIAGAQAFATLEPGRTMWDGLWWAATTTTTVGYGDVYPTTTAGKAIAIGLMLVGIGFVAMLTAAIAQRFVRGQAEVPASGDLRVILDELRALGDRIERLEDLLARRATRDEPSESLTRAP